MYRIVWCVAAALLAFSTVLPPAAAGDRDTCGSHRPGIDEAIAACDRLIRQNPKDAQAYFGRALEYNAKGDDDRALADYGEAIRLKPKVSGYYEGRGDVYSHKGEYDRAIADYSEAIRLEPKFTRVYVDRARVYMSRRDYDHAIADYDQAIKIDAKWPHSNVYDGRGDAYEAKGDLDRAIADYDQALKYDPANAEARRHRERATAALAARQIPAKPQTHADVTAAILAQLARPQPSPADAAADDRGTCMSSSARGKEEEVIAACGRLIERNPNDAVAYLRRGSAYDRKGDVGHASADFDRAIELNPKDPTAYFGRGKVNASRGRGDHAIADFDQAIRLDPRYAEAYDGRGSVLTSLRQYDRAIADLDEAIRLDPNTAHAYSSRGRAYEERGDLERAITDYDEALRIDPEDSRASFNRNRAQAALASRPAPTKPQVTDSQPASSSAAERRVALVIGNSRYASAPALPNPRRDAEAVAKALREDGFQTVMLVSDIGRDALREALRKFRAEADKADWGLVYYAGHGIQIGKTNYLIPVDAKLADERDVQGETIPYGEVEAAVGGARALRIIILDACRNDPFEAQMARPNSSRSLARGLSPPPEPDAGLLVVYSAKDGQVAEDGDGANSPFAMALVAQLKVPRREVRRVFDYVREEVMNATGRRQQPFTYGSLPGSKDYYFVAGK